MVPARTGGQLLNRLLSEPEPRVALWFECSPGVRISRFNNNKEYRPVIINEDDLDKYFNLKIEGTNFLKSYPMHKLQYYPVSRDVNKPTNNNERLIEAIKN